MASGVINTLTNEISVLNDKTSRLNSTGTTWSGMNLELTPNNATDNHGGYIDFHYNQSTANYTSRIIEGASGRINVTASAGVFIGGNQVYVMPKTVTFTNWHNMVLMRTDSTNFYFYVQGLHIAPVSSSNIRKSSSLSVTQMTKIDGANSYTGTVTVTAVYQRSDGLEIVATIANSVTGNGMAVLSGTVTTN